MWHQKKLINKTKNVEIARSVEVVKVVLVQHILVDNQCKQMSEVLYFYSQLILYLFVEC